jgi:hypothetical protein
MIRFILVVAFITITIRSQAQESIVPNLRDSLWQQNSIDTFPYLRSYQATNKMALSYSLLWLLGRDTDSAGHALSMMQAYYYNLLAGRFNTADTIAIAAESQYPDVNRDLQGHYGLKYLVPCFGISSDSCRKMSNLALQYFDYAAKHSGLMPKNHWKWLANQIRGQLPFPVHQHLKHAEDNLMSLTGPAWEGGTLAFQRTPGTTNLLVSNGSRYPLQILEWDNKLQAWKDVTNLTGLDSMPGGHRMYSTDFNNDGYDDLLILRKSSVPKSPAVLFPTLLKNNRQGGFIDVTYAAGFQKIDRANCACWGDINGDGLQDVFLGNEYGNSFWMVQDSSGSFSNMALAYGIQTKKQIVSNCALIDINGDGLKDLFLSIRDNNNKMYVQTMLEGGYRFFFDKADTMGLLGPKMIAHSIVSDYNRDGKDDLILIPELSDRSDLIADIMHQEDTVLVEPAVVVYANTEGQLSVRKDTLPKELSLLRAGIIIHQPQYWSIIYGGGKSTESLLPCMFYASGDSNISIQYPENWPAYVHSATAFENNGEPLLTFRGGSMYPFMVNRQMSYHYTGPTGGKLHKITDLSHAPFDAVVHYTIKTPDNTLLKQSFTRQANDSRGFYALQEWIWLPDGYQLSDVKAEKYIDRKEEIEVKKKGKKKKKM